MQRRRGGTRTILDDADVARNAWRHHGLPVDLHPTEERIDPSDKNHRWCPFFQTGPSPAGLCLRCSDGGSVLAMPPDFAGSPATSWCSSPAGSAQRPARPIWLTAALALTAQLHREDARREARSRFVSDVTTPSRLRIRRRASSSSARDCVEISTTRSHLPLVE